MTEKEMKRLKRTELLEMLIEEKKENERLRAQLDAAHRELKDRRLAISNAGSIADAALAVNKVFESAQRAADQYLANVRAITRDGK